MTDSFHEVLAAIRLPSHELFCEALKKVKDVNAPLPWGTTVLHAMVSERKTRETTRVEDFKKLIEVGADVNARTPRG